MTSGARDHLSGHLRARTRRDYAVSSTAPCEPAGRCARDAAVHAHGRRGADLCGLVAPARRERPQLALPLQVDEVPVEVARHDHHLVEPARRFGRQVAAVSCLGGRRPVPIR